MNDIHRQDLTLAVLSTTNKVTNNKNSKSVTCRETRKYAVYCTVTSTMTVQLSMTRRTKKEINTMK